MTGRTPWLLVVRFSNTVTVRGEPFDCAQESLVEPLLPGQYWPATGSQEMAFLYYKSFV
jgi:hypothetical protein